MMDTSTQDLELWHSRGKSWLCKSEPLLNKEDQLIVESLYSLISLGTERLLTTEILSEVTAEKMRVPHMKGDFRGKFTYGYSLVGKIVEGPSDLKGRSVHLMHPHQSRVAVSRKDVTLLPEGLNPKVASLASNMETAVNAVWDSNLQLGDRVLIIGYGIIGALISLLAKRITGIDVIILESNKDKDVAIEHAGHQQYQSNSSEFDIVFNTSSNQDMLQEAISLTRQEGKIIEVSWYGEQKVEINLGSDFHYGRKQIICSQVSQIPYSKQPVWNYRRRKNLVFKLLKELNPIGLIDLELAFADVPNFFEKLRKESINQLGVVIKY